jgi:hypothetical protein
MRTNLLMTQFKGCTEQLRYKLFKTFCMSLYGCQLWDLESKDINIFYTAWRKCIRRIYDIPTRTHCNLLNIICGDAPISQQLDKRFIKFFYRSQNCKNHVVKLCSRLALGGSGSAMCNSINTVCEKYKINKYDLSKSSLRSLENRVSNYTTYSNDVLSRGLAITDFIEYKRISHNIEDIQCIIDYLCTS